MWQWAAVLLTWQPAEQPRLSWDRSSSECCALSDLPAGHPTSNLDVIICLSPGKSCRARILTGLLANQAAACISCSGALNFGFMRSWDRSVGGACLEHASSMYEAGGWRQPALCAR